MMLLGQIVQIIAANMRVGWALFGSILIHLALLLAMATHVWKLHRVVPGEVAMALHGRIVAIQTVDKQIDAEAVHDVPPEPVTPDAQPNIAVSRPQVQPEMPPISVEERAPQPKPPEFGGEMIVRYGVSVTETLYQRALPRQFETDLRNFPGFVRSTDLDQRPKPVELVVPDVASGLFAAKISGSITMALFIDEFGHVIDVVPVVAGEDIDKHAVEIAVALRQSTFTAGKLNGRSVRSISFQVVRFGQQLLPPSGPLVQ